MNPISNAQPQFAILSIVCRRCPCRLVGSSNFTEKWEKCLKNSLPEGNATALRDEREGERYGDSREKIFHPSL